MDRCFISKAWALTQGFSRLGSYQQMNSVFKAVTPSPASGEFFAEGDLVREGGNPNGGKMEANEVFVVVFAADGFFA